MFSMKMEDRPLIQLENDLDRFGGHALPYATRDTMNTVAFQSSVLAKKNVKRKFIARNKWTERSVQFQKTFSRDIDNMESEMGSVQEYMREQEEGFTRHKKGKHGVVIPTGAAAGQMGTRRRTRRLQKKNWMASVNPEKGNGQTGMQRIVDSVRNAVTTGNRTIFLKSSDDTWRRTTGIYRVIGGKKNTTRGWPRGAKLQLLYQIEKPSVRTDPHPWMELPVKVAMKNLDKIYRDALIRQIRINRSFRNR